MSSEIVIVTEGETDAKVLCKLFKDKLVKNKIEIISAKGFSSALSKVKSLLSIKNKKILLILDTDTNDKFEIKTKEDFVNSYINKNFYAENFKTFWAVPEFEIIFLKNKKFLNEITNQNLDNYWIELAENAPKKSLEQLSNRKFSDLIPLLDKKEVREEFFKEGLVKEINDQIEK